MLGKPLFQIICCPRCNSELTQDHRLEVRLTCASCGLVFPVVDDIPVLLVDTQDEISQRVRDYYEARWQRNENGVLIAKSVHQDLSTLGQSYIKLNEGRFHSFFEEVSGNRGFFLDVGCGAHPRTSFAQGYRYHVCVDFSMNALVECRRLLGERAICICASVLALPLKDQSCDAVIASHCLYHIDKALQSVAVKEIARVKGRNANVLILYRNPNSLERRFVSRQKRTSSRLEQPRYLAVGEHYYYAHPIPVMLNMLTSVYKEARVQVVLLRLFSRNATEQLFKLRWLGRLLLAMVVLSEKMLSRRANLATYVAYMVIP